MNKQAWGRVCIVIAMIAFLGCESLDKSGEQAAEDLALSKACSDATATQLEDSMTSTLSGAETEVDFTLLLETGSGRSYGYSRGLSTADTSYESASTSKLVTAVVILALVDRNYLTLDSRPQDFISFWTPAADNAASGITLRHLLDFTSGFSNEPLCINSPTYDFASCVQNIYNNNINNNITPGSQFYYSSNHLQIAGLMAMKAGGFSTWTDVFDDFKARTGLFAHSAYDLPSATNPRLAGGMHWTASDYLGFLRALYAGHILSEGLSAQLWQNQRGDADVVNSPVLSDMGEDWGYALGNWVECKSPTYDCGTARNRNSSPGAYGAYPFIDFTNGYFGILARQGEQGTFPEGIDLFRTVEDTAASWSAGSCGTGAP